MLSRISKLRRQQVHQKASIDSREANFRHKLIGLTLGLPVLLLVMFVVFGGIWIFDYYRDVANQVVEPRRLLDQYSRGSARIYDRNGELLYQFVDPAEGLREPVPLDEISPWLVEATIAVEDPTFYTNNGLNSTGLLRAGIENLLPWFSSPTDEFFQGSGGSSITQQLAKNIYIPQQQRYERSYLRKMKETVVALELTRKYEKDNILVWYLNSISYGGPYVGIEAAAIAYFGKHSNDLTLAEASLLAGIPQSPAKYDPFSPINFDPSTGQLVWGSPAKFRQRTVLNLMVRRGVITEAQADATLKAPLTFKTVEFDIEAPHFVLGRVTQELVARFGTFAIYNDGLEVTTTLDLSLQKNTERIVDNTIREKGEEAGLFNGAVMVLDPKTGQILTYVGSRDYFRDDIEGRNDNIISLNSPGSTLKPFGYMAAFMKGWGTRIAVLDTPLVLMDKETETEWRPVDPLDYWVGPLAAAESLGNSLNVSAIKMALFAGVPDLLQVLRGMGYTTLDNPQGYGPALITGGSDITLFDHVIGYSVLANNGIMRGQFVLDEASVDERSRDIEPISLLKVTDFSGETRLLNNQFEEKRIVDARYAWLTTSILADGDNQCLVYATCDRLRVLEGYPTAAKTGTSEPFARESMPGQEVGRLVGETWTMGYSPNIVVGVWAGNSDNAIIKDIYSTTVAFPIWKQVMLNSIERFSLQADEFIRPPGISEVEVCWPSGRLVTPECPDFLREKSLYATEILNNISRISVSEQPPKIVTATPVPKLTSPDDLGSLEDSTIDEIKQSPAVAGWEVGKNYISPVDGWWQMVIVDWRNGSLAMESTPDEFRRSSLKLIFPWNEISEWESIWGWASSKGVQDFIPWSDFVSEPTVLYESRVSSGSTAPNDSKEQSGSAERAALPTELKYPVPHQILSGQVQIMIDQTRSDVVTRVIELQKVGQDSWSILSTLREPTPQEHKFEWETELFADGEYILRFTEFHTHEFRPESYYQIPIRLQNQVSGAYQGFRWIDLEDYQTVTGLKEIQILISGAIPLKLEARIGAGNDTVGAYSQTFVENFGSGRVVIPLDSKDLEDGIYTLQIIMYSDDVPVANGSRIFVVNNKIR